MQSQWPSRLFSMKEELLRGKRYREMQLVCGSEPAYFRTTVHFFLRYFFLAKLILQCPWKLHHAKFFRCKTWVCLCQLTEKSQDPLGLSLEVKKKYPLKIPLTPLRDSFYKHIRKIKSSASLYALQLGCEGQWKTKINWPRSIFEKHIPNKELLFKI